MKITKAINKYKINLSKEKKIIKNVVSIINQYQIY